jgi:hypothetical protein
MPTDNKRLRCAKKTCQRQFTRPQGTNRIYCFECHPQRPDPRTKSSSASCAKVAQFSERIGENVGEGGPVEGKLAKLSRIQLEEWGVSDTWQGQAALALAALIDEGGKGGGSGGAASAVKAHREAMQVAHDAAEIVEVDNVTSIFENQA